MALPSFKVGTKELFLPEFAIALIRSSPLLPNQAKFNVPLWFSKLDLRDYLWHVYGVEILNIRSYVKQSRVQSGLLEDIRPKVRRWHRPPATKFMTVELARPFVWPEEPENFEEWNQVTVKMNKKEQADASELRSTLKDAVVNEERRERMREQAQALLEGKAQWKKPDYRNVSSDMISRLGR